MIIYDVRSFLCDTTFRLNRHISTLLAPTKRILCIQGLFDMPNSILIFPKPQIGNNYVFLMIFIFVQLWANSISSWGALCYITCGSLARGTISAAASIRWARVRELVDFRNYSCRV